MIREKVRNTPSGIPLFVAMALVLAGSLYVMVRALTAGNVAIALVSGVVGLADLICFFGLFMVNPNEGRVLQLFGRYVGTVNEPGLRWASPFYTKRRVSQRVRNFESARLKVNDLDGNPIDIAAVVVWKVIDTAEAVFEVDNFENYVHVQTEAALRNMATSYPYDAHEDGKMSLRGNTAEIAEHLKTEIQERLLKAGVGVIEARISHLAYAPEIASAMLQRQQAGAIIAARARIVEGAVTMVQMALERLEADKIIAMDEDKKATMVSNLLVVLCGHGSAQPVINTGTLYQ